MSKQFYLKTSSLAKEGSLNVKTVLFSVNQFTKSSQFSSIWQIDRTLSGANTPGQSEPGSNVNVGYSAFPKSPALLELYYQIV